ncbi:FAD-dependent oxidoreductase [Aeromicrobium stalagmiti]|uniref:FAD-dependent oxidoreductase n=1 Tax=Aeromicrobium stalagmiti TaxID=2738988 RepID=UPI001569E3BC|nr:FAD-dependent oxidoreductase [Aeromicrobium stalagmiti]NRQ50329.1 NAD(P)/FAD-dependent oxidoreductase [Aeromicrobium stalagmiti]
MKVVVVGAGMVGNRFVDELGRLAPQVEIDLLGDESYEPYNRVMLTELIAGRVDLAGLTLPTPDHGRVRVRAGVRALEIDRERRTVVTADGDFAYDVLVLATGAQARVIPVPGLRDGLPRGAHVVRRLDDARDITAATLNASDAVVIGAGPLGVEAACALRHRGIAVTLVAASDLLNRDLDPEVASVAADQAASLGIEVVTDAQVASVGVHAGRVDAVHLADGRTFPAGIVVLACGSAPDTTLAAEAGLDTNVGIVVGHDLRTPADLAVCAIGDCAETPAGVSGLVAPGWAQARALARSIAHASELELPTVAGSAMRLKAVGMSVVTMGARTSTARPDDRVVTLSDRRERRHVELVVRGDTLVGVTCVGAPDLAAHLSTQFDRPGMLPADPMHLLMGTSGIGATESASPTAMPAATTVCRCNGVTKGDLVHAWDGGATTVEALADATLATTGCGGCTQLVCGIVDWLQTTDPPPVPTTSQPDGSGRETTVPTR